MDVNETRDRGSSHSNPPPLTVAFRADHDRRARGPGSGRLEHTFARLVVRQQHRFGGLFHLSILLGLGRGGTEAAGDHAPVSDQWPGFERYAQRPR